MIPGGGIGLAACVVIIISIMIPPGVPAADQWSPVLKMIGEQDAVLIANHTGKIIVAKNENKPLIPASTLKLLTSLAAIHYLGINYRFVTEFYLDDRNDLKIKGYGDPLLISEVLAAMTRQFSQAATARQKAVNDLILDDSYFATPIEIPGISSMQPFQPYNAPVGALCVNFNTVAFKTAPGPQRMFVSDEPQTPLLPFAKHHLQSRIKDGDPEQGRMIFLDEHHEHTMYAGHLVQYFLMQSGIRTNGTIRIGKINPHTDRLVFRYVSSFSLEEIISRLLVHSNNFIANQLFITCGIRAFGPPGTLDKGVRAANNYIRTHFSHDVCDDVCLEEGSGVSRNNKVSAKMMHRILMKFAPYYQLMRHDDAKGNYYKTGTLDGIRTRAGYFADKKGRRYDYVVMLNSPGKSAEAVAGQMMEICNQSANPRISLSLK